MKTIVVSNVVIISICANAQDYTTKTTYHDNASLGLGVGLDYGTLGANLLYYNTPEIGYFAGLGFTPIGPAVNLGLKARLLSKKKVHKVTPNAIVMYGTNAVLLVKNAAYFNMFSFGPTFGLGADFNFKKEKKGYWSINLLMPVRSKKFNSHYDQMKEIERIKFTNEITALTFSIGYRFVLSDSEDKT